MPRLATVAILYADVGKPASGRSGGRARVTAPAQAADLIDQFRSEGVSLVYDPVAKTQRTDPEDTLTLSIG